MTDIFEKLKALKSKTKIFSLSIYLMDKLFLGRIRSTPYIDLTQFLFIFVVPGCEAEDINVSVMDDQLN